MKTKAFTLIELLVVVAIIGILAAVGVVAYNGYTSAAKINAVKSNFKNPYLTKIVGVRSSTIYNNRDRKNGAQDLEVKIKVLQYNGVLSGFICCHTLGLVAIQRKDIEAVKLKNFDCEGTCCFVISTVYDVDSNGNGLVKIDTVSGNTCTR